MVGFGIRRILLHHPSKDLLGFLVSRGLEKKEPELEARLDEVGLKLERPPVLPLRFGEGLLKALNLRDSKMHLWIPGARLGRFAEELESLLPILQPRVEKTHLEERCRLMRLQGQGSLEMALRLVPEAQLGVGRTQIVVSFRQALFLLESEGESGDGFGKPAHAGIDRSQGSERLWVPGIIGEEGLEALGGGLEVRAPQGSPPKPEEHFGVSRLSQEDRTVDGDRLSFLSKRLTVLGEEQSGARPARGDSV